SIPISAASSSPGGGGGRPPGSGRGRPAGSGRPGRSARCGVMRVLPWSPRRPTTRLRHLETGRSAAPACRGARSEPPVADRGEGAGRPARRPAVRSPARRPAVRRPARREERAAELAFEDLAGGAGGQLVHEPDPPRVLVRGDPLPDPPAQLVLARR